MASTGDTIDSQLDSQPNTLDESSRAVLVYDADCGFCAASARWLAGTGRVPLMAWQDLPSLAEHRLSEADVRAAAWWLEVDPPVRESGAGAIGRALVARGGLAAGAGRVVLSRPVRPFAEAVYRLVSSNRHRLPGGTAACRVPAGPNARFGLRQTVDWLLANRLRGWAVIGVIALQVMVPVMALLDPPSRLGFQMYSGLGYLQAQAWDEHGEPLEVRLGDLLAGGARADVDFLTDLPDHLCAEVSGAVKVKVSQNGREVTRRCG